MLSVPQASAETVLSAQVTAQSTPKLPESLLTTGVNLIPAVLPTGTDVLVGAGLRAIETPLAWLEETLLLLPHATKKPTAAAKGNVRIRRLAGTANLLGECNVMERDGVTHKT